MKPSGRLTILIIIVAALLSTGIHLYHYEPDDTFITLRYARNVALGRGFAFNPGERLEGYTNFLWLIILVLAGRLGLPLNATARLLGLLFSGATLVLVWAMGRDYARRLPGGGWRSGLGAAVPPMLLAASAPFLTWSLSGTEIPLFTFLLLLGFDLLRRTRDPAAVFAVFGLLGLVRPEGIVFFALSFVVLLTSGRKRSDVIFKAAGVLALFYAPYAAWKLHYFGSLLPNTFYAKTGPMGLMIRNGGRYVSGFLAGYGYLSVIGLILLRKRIRSRELVVLPLSFTVLHWITLLFLGGDWMPHYRLLLPTLPLVLLLLANGLTEAAAEGRTVSERTSGRAGMGSTGGAAASGSGEPEIVAATRPAGERPAGSLAVAAVMFVFLAMVPGGLGYDDFKAERLAVRIFTRLGKTLSEILPQGTRLACGSTGAIGYYTDLPIVDILGLTEAHIARHGRIVAFQPGHMKADGRYVLEREPDLLLLGNIQIHLGRRGPERMKHKIQEEEIIKQPSFTRDYEFVNIPLGRNFYLSCYKRKGFFLPLEQIDDRAHGGS